MLKDINVDIPEFKSLYEDLQNFINEDNILLFSKTIKKKLNSEDFLSFAIFWQFTNLEGITFI